MRITEQLPVDLNLRITLIDKEGRHLWHQNTHNIVVNTGRQFLAEVITPDTLGLGSFTRTQNTCVRYVGFGIGGAMQSSTSAGLPPYSDIYPAGYDYVVAGTHNTQADDDVTVGILERPVKVTNTLWMQEISTGGTFPTATSTRFIATFGATDINIGSFVSVPISEIGLYKSSADPTLPNGGGVYPGSAGHLIAYDTFNTIQKTGVFSIEVWWEWRFGA